MILMDADKSKRYLVVVLVLAVLALTFVVWAPMDNVGMASTDEVGQLQQDGNTAIGTGVVKFKPSGGK